MEHGAFGFCTTSSRKNGLYQLDLFMMMVVVVVVVVAAAVVM
jgi:hypothetical protein